MKKILKKAEAGKFNGMKKVVEIVNSSDRDCLICGSDVKVYDLKLNRKNGTNIIRFAVCSTCLNEMAEELKNQIKEEQ